MFHLYWKKGQSRIPRVLKFKVLGAKMRGSSEDKMKDCLQKYCGWTLVQCSGYKDEKIWFLLPKNIYAMIVILNTDSFRNPYWNFCCTLFCFKYWYPGLTLINLESQVFCAASITLPEGMLDYWCDNPYVGFFWIMLY